LGRAYRIRLSRALRTMDHSQALPFEMSELLSDAVCDHYYDDECATMTIGCDDSDACTENDGSDASDSELEEEEKGEEEAFELQVGTDLSIYLGRDLSKAPKFGRFASCGSMPIRCGWQSTKAASIQAAVQEMRLLAGAARSLKQRSWAASFSFTKRLSKTPQYECYASPCMNIQAAVQEMRLAAARRAPKKMGWAASFEFTGRSSKKPQFARFARKFVGHIEIDVQKMRRAVAATRASKNRSWAATFSFTGKSATVAKFARFAKPSAAIDVDVQFMRLLAGAMKSSVLQPRAATKCTSTLWSCTIKKTVCMQDRVLIEDVHDEITESTSGSLASSSPSSTPKMLMAPPSEMEETCQKLQALLKAFQQEVLRVQGKDVKLLGQRLALIEPSVAPASLMPAEPRVEERAPTDFSAHGSSTWMWDFETELQSTELEADLENLGEQCARKLKQFQLEVASYEDAQIIEQLIQEEQSQQERLDVEVDQLIGEELLMASKTSTWVAGSPAAAARRMRRSASSTFHGEKAVRSTGSNSTALALDLGLDLSQCAPRGSPSSTRAQKSARSSSTTAVGVARSKKVESLRPLVVSKSSSMLPAFASAGAGGDAYAWSVGPLKTRMTQRRDPSAWNMGGSSRSFGNLGALF